MGSMEELETGITGAIDKAGEAEPYLNQAGNAIEQAQQVLAQVVEGSGQQDVENANAYMARVINDLDLVFQSLRQGIEATARARNSIGSSAVGSTVENPSAQSAKSASAERPPEIDRKPSQDFQPASVTETDVQHAESETGGTGQPNMIKVKDATEKVGIARNRFDDLILPETPRLVFPTAIRVPEEYIGDLANSAAWRDRDSHTGGAREFAASAHAVEITDRTISDYEARIDNELRNNGAKPLPNRKVAELLGVSQGIVENWKVNGPLQGKAILDDPAKGIAPHELFKLYEWQRPGAQSERSTPEPEHKLMTRNEVAELLHMTTSGVQKTDDFLHSVNLVTGSRRYYPKEYVEALAASPLIRSARSVTTAAREFAETPEAARAMARSEVALENILDQHVDEDGRIIIAPALGAAFGLNERTIRNWRENHVLPILWKFNHSDQSRATQTNFNRVYNWKYPLNYPQNGSDGTRV